ncbi:uncharacterized protein [Dysidea avara]
MSTEISSVQRLIRSFIKTERSDPLAYILTTFNDPDVGVPQIYSASHVAELTALEAAVNVIRANGGGDCPELGMTGILNALSLANPDSNVIVLTDASPKDANRTQEVIDKATELRNSIHFFLSRSGCGDFSPYLEVANATFGIVVNRIDDFEAFVEFADKVGRFSFDLVDTDSGSKKKRQTPENCITFSTSTFTQSINILFSSVSSAITITGPSGVVETVTTSGTIATYSNNDPEAGVYSVCSVGTFKHSLSTTSDLDFFVDYIDADISSTSLPVPGTPVRLLISSSRIDDISTDEVFLNLVLADGAVSSNALTRCDGLLTGVIIVPNAPFRYQLEGYDTDGNRFTRTRDALIEAENVECEVPTPDTTSTITPTSTSVAHSSTPVILYTSVLHTSSVVLFSISSSTSTTIPTSIPTSTPSGCSKGFTGRGCNIVVALEECPIIIEEYVEPRTEATNTTKESVREVFSRVLMDPTLSDDDLSDKEVYEQITDSLKVSSSPAGFRQFQEAVSEIASATFRACAAPEESRVRPDDIPDLTKRFFTLSDAGDINEARKVYGTLLCLRSLLSPADDGKKVKRQGDSFDELEDFFDSLDSDRITTIFGIVLFSPVPPTLAFVVDDTGSMSAEISSVQRLIRSFIKTERSEPLAYILTTFNDPGVGVPQIYSASSVAELTALETAVNAIKANGGGDCPELGMTGILNALSLANPDSNVIVLTDASPKDVNRTQEVIDKATELHNSIHFFLSRSGCGDFSPYIEVANATFGIVVNRIDDFEAFVEFADRAGRFTLGDDEEGKRKRRAVPSPSRFCVTFSTSIFTTSVNILFSSVTSTINVTSPSGLSSLVSTRGSIATYSNDSIEVGEYHVCSSGQFKHTVSMTSSLDFFVEHLEDDFEIPIPGSAGIVVVSSSQMEKITVTDVRPVVLKFVSTTDGQVFNATQLLPCSGFLIGEITIPNESFRYVLEGYDCEGNKFSQTSLTTPFTFPNPSPTSIVPTSTSRVVASPTSTSTVVITSSPTPSPTPDCPCLNGGRCVTILRFGRKRTFCHCRSGYTGSLCHFKLLG